MKEARAYSRLVVVSATFGDRKETIVKIMGALGPKNDIPSEACPFHPKYRRQVEC